MNPVALSRMVFGMFAPFALLLGLVTATAPVKVWGWLGVEPGNAAFIAILYGSVLLAVGAISLLALRDPVRHATLLLFIGIYKLAAALLLTVHGLATVMPLVGWAIAVLYLFLALLALWLYAGLSRHV